MKPAFPSPNQKIRFALLGCGRISGNHFEAIGKQAAGAELVAVCDTNPDALIKAAHKTGAQPFPNLNEMLESAGANVISICTPSGLHAEQTIQAARAGVHVICEKPMAIRLHDGRAMIHECQKAGVRLFVVKQNRYNPTLQLLKKAIDSGRFGKIYMASVNVFWTRGQDYYDQAKWRGTRAMDGGAFMNQASHYVDLLTWLLGPIEKVHAFTATLARKIEMEDTGVAAIRWKSGALGSVSTTMLTYPKNLEGSVTIIGEKGTVRVGGVAVNEIQSWQFAEPTADDQRIKDANYQTTSVYGHGHVPYYENVISILRGEKKSADTIDGTEGLQSLATLEAIYDSVRTGETVSPTPEL